jgi:hypothetical protein
MPHLRKAWDVVSNPIGQLAYGKSNETNRAITADKQHIKDNTSLTSKTIIMLLIIKNLARVITILFLFTATGCKKDNTDSFCTVTRTLATSVNSQNGIIIYYQKYNRYGVRVSVQISGNIDTQIIGLACDIPKELQAEGTNVKVSGSLKKFNSNENITPQMAGDDLYYLEISQITKQ